MLTRDVAPGIHRVEDAHTNWYLVEDDGAVAIIDAGVPRTSWPLLHDALRQLGRTAGDLRALVLTHGTSTTSALPSARGVSSGCPSSYIATTSR